MHARGVSLASQRVRELARVIDRCVRTDDSVIHVCEASEIRRLTTRALVP